MAKEYLPEEIAKQKAVTMKEQEEISVESFKRMATKQMMKTPCEKMSDELLERFKEIMEARLKKK